MASFGITPSSLKVERKRLARKQQKQVIDYIRSRIETANNAGHVQISILMTHIAGITEETLDLIAKAGFKVQRYDTGANSTNQFLSISWEDENA